MSMKRATLLLMLLTLLTLLLVSCAPKEEPAQVAPAAAPTQPAVEKQLVVFCQSTNVDPWRQAMNADMEDAAAKYPDIKLEILDGQNRNETQLANVEDAVAKGCKVLIISPREAQPLTKAVEEVYNKGIPVILLDRSINSDKYTSFIGASNVELGKMAGEYVAKQLKGKGNVVEIQGIAGATPTKDRHNGFHEALKAYPGIKVLNQAQYADYLRSKAMPVMEDALQKYKTLDCVYAHNDEMALGALKAAQDAGRAKEILFVGIDGQREALEAIMAGDMSATFVYPTCSNEAIDLVEKLLAGAKADVPKQVPLKTIAITKENAEKYYDKTRPMARITESMVKEP
jgi:ribose transport system substrate-binding protein